MKLYRLNTFVFALFISGFSLFADSFLDTTFDPGTGVNGFVECAAVQPDGKILIAGNFTAFNGTPRSYMARLNSNGSLDTTFVASPNYWVRFMALQPDGKIVIGGFFTSVDGLPRSRVARINADGSVDTTFNPGAGCEGRMVAADPTAPFLFALGIQPDGKIIIGGNFTNYNKAPRMGVARLNADGSLDTGFNVGSGVDSWVRSILILPNNQIMLSGWFENYNSRGHDRMVRLNLDGTSDESFKTRIGYSTSIYTMALQPDGKLVVGGHSVNTNSPFSQEVVRLNLDGTYDLSFNPGGEGADDKVESVVILPDGKFLIGGYFGLYNGTRAKGIARLNTEGTLDTNFIASANNWIWSVALQNDGKFLIAGAFSMVDGISRNGIARLNLSDEVVEPPPPPPPPTDLTAPSISITSPTTGSRVFSPTVTGHADDDVAVTEVLYRVGSGDFIPANGTTNWSATPSLQPGNNTIEVKSVDAAGNESAIASRTFFWIASSPLQLEIVGPGTTTITNEQFLEIGKSYSIKATPSGANLFLGWSGSVTSSATTLRFMMRTNFVLKANFATNIFSKNSGIYNGLFSNSNGIVPGSAGFLTINLKTSGKFSGTILLEGGRSPLSGRFNLEGDFQKNISRGVKPALEVNLQLEPMGGLAGTILQNGEFSSLVAERGQPTLNSAKTRYTLLIPPGTDSATLPGGYGHGSALVDPKGKMNFRGALADGTTVLQNCVVSENARWPLYVSLYRGKGLIFGWLNFTNETDSDLRGENVAWTKLAGVPGKFYPAGFSLTGTVVGSTYTTPAFGAAPINWTNGIMELGGGNLVDSMSNSVTMGNNRKLIVDSNTKMVMNSANANGLLNGSFIHPNTGKRAVLKGALLQKQQIAAGTFLGTNESGYFLIRNNP